MVYNHSYFTLDTEAKRVFDENGKELRLTGNPYRLLVFLCEKKAVNLTEIGQHLDWAKDYNEDHIRQYRYKIETLVGHDIIDYQNGIYRLVGDVSEGNTDLLRPNTLVSNSMKKAVKFVRWPAILAIIGLLLAVLPLPYGYFTLLRFIVTAAAIYYGYYLYSVSKQTDFLFWALVFVAVLFNPIVPIYLGLKLVWAFFDIVVAIFFIVVISKLKRLKHI